MTKNLKAFILLIILGIPFWLGVNYFQKNIEGFLYLEEINSNPSEMFVADLSFKYEKEKPELTADSAISVIITGDKEKIIYSKERNKRLPIASITKLMTALVADEFYEEDLKVRITEDNFSRFDEKIGVGDLFTVNQLVNIMLIGSNNTAASSLADIIGEKGFINLMNLKAKNIGMQNTYFYNPNGLDPVDGGGENTNFSTAYDLVTLAKNILQKDSIKNIISQKKYYILNGNGEIKETFYNTNELMMIYDNIVGSKTGYTALAGECLLMILEQDGKYIVNIVLGSLDRFDDMKKLTDYGNSKY